MKINSSLEVTGTVEANSFVKKNGTSVQFLKADGSVDTTSYLPTTLTSAKGDIIYASAANTPARLPIGSEGQVLKVSGGVPVWGADSNTNTWRNVKVDATQVLGTGTDTGPLAFLSQNTNNGDVSFTYDSTNKGVKATAKIPTALKNPNAIKIQGGGQDVASYDGSTAKTINIAASSTAGAFTISDGTTTRTIQLAGSFTDYNQTIKVGNTTFGASDAVDFLGTSPISVTANATNKTITIAVADASTSAKGVIKIGTTASDAAAGNHTHSITLASDSGTSSISLAHGGKYKLTAGGNSVIFTMPGIPDYLAAVASIGGNNTSTYSYHRIMRLNASHGYADTEGTFYLTGNYINGPYYIFRVEQRANADNAAPSDTVIKVLMTNSDPANLKLGQYNYTSNGVNYVQTDIFVKVGTWPRMTLYKLGQNTAGSFTFFNSSEGSDASSHTEAYKDINGSNAEYASYACIGASSYTRTANGAVAVSTGYAASSHSHTITANATDGIWDITGTDGTNAVTYAVGAYSAKGTSARFYTAATNPTLTTRLNYDGYFYATKLYSGGNEVLTGHQSIKSLDTTATTAQSTNNNEAIAGSGKITLHKVSKTGSYDDLNDKPTIPATNVIPVIGGLGNGNHVLLSTEAAGTAYWSNWSTPGVLMTNNQGVVSPCTQIKLDEYDTLYIKTLNIGEPNAVGNSYIRNEAPSGLQLPKNQTFYLPYMANADSGVLATQYWVRQQGYTSNTGTVTSVRVQAGTGLSSSQSTAQTGTLDTTISIASGYKLPTTTEWNSKIDMSDVYGFGDYVAEAFLDNNYPSFIKLVDDGHGNPKFAFDTTNYSVVSGVNDGTNWTSITINGVTKNIPSGGSGSLTLDNVSDGTTRKLNQVTAATGKAKLGVKTVGVKPHQSGDGYLELSDSSVSQGTTTYYRDRIVYGSKALVLPTRAGVLALVGDIKHLYKHWVIFNVYSDIYFKFEFYSTSTTSSSTLTAANLLQMLQGKIVGAVNNNSGSSVMLSVHQAIQANTYQGFIYYVGGSYVEFYPFAVNAAYVTIEDSGYEEV